MEELRIATRKSRLALWQANRIKAELERHHAGLGVVLVGITTEGDRRLDAQLSSIGGKGLFIKALEAALVRGEADLAVHSMKDLPAILDARFTLAAIGFREDARDAWVSTRGTVDTLPQGAQVGSSSLRRQAQLLAVRSDLKMVPIRGNVETRLHKLDTGAVDALLLAAAGLKRLGLASRITEALSLQRCLPAAGQGALGVECCMDNEPVRTLLEPLNDPAVSRCVQAERAISAALGADCSMPLGAHAELANGSLHLRAVLGSPDGHTLLRAAAIGRDGRELATSVVEELRRQGADKLLNKGLSIACSPDP